MRTIGIAVVALVLLVAGAVWALRNRTDVQVERIKQVSDKMFIGVRPKKEELEQFGKIREISPDRRMKVFEHMTEIAERQMEKQVDAYFALAPEKRDAYLDEQILDQEKAQQEMEKLAKEKGATNLAAGGPGTGSPPSGISGGSGGPSASPGAGSERRNQMLDNTSPELRAKMTAFMKDMQRRRIALGLPADAGMMIKGPGYIIVTKPGL